MAFPTGVIVSLVALLSALVTQASSQHSGLSQRESQGVGWLSWSAPLDWERTETNAKSTLVAGAFQDARVRGYFRIAAAGMAMRLCWGRPAGGASQC